MKVIHFKNRMLPFFFSQWSHEGRFLHIAIILPSPWLQPGFSIGWQRSLPDPSSVLISCTTKLLCYPITLTTAGGDDPDSQWRRPWLRGGAIREIHWWWSLVLFTNCNFRFLFVWSSRASLVVCATCFCKVQTKASTSISGIWERMTSRWDRIPS